MRSRTRTWPSRAASSHPVQRISGWISRREHKRLGGILGLIPTIFPRVCTPPHFVEEGLDTHGIATGARSIFILFPISQGGGEWLVVRGSSKDEDGARQWARPRVTDGSANQGAFHPNNSET